MRVLSELMSKHNNVWFIIDDEYKTRFVDECNENGYAFKPGTRSAGSLTLQKCGMRMALCADDKTIWYISGMCYHYSFAHPHAIISTNDSGIGLRINYKAYTTGEPQYIYIMKDELVAPEEL